ncbi:hypothetical protein [Falsirhodobacter deserti]|nr:hypothetical protein [Falsirhodobacter deserti]
MTNKVALWLAAIIIAAIVIDVQAEWGGVTFLMRKFLKLVDWVEFWR